MSKGEEEEGLLNQRHQHSYVIVISQCSEVIYLNLDHAETLDKEGTSS